MEDEAKVDSLSYKELQSLAISLKLPGKMKSGVLVEAIKARRSHNEQAVEAILEANKQRLNFRRRQQSEKQQMLYKMTNEPKKTFVSRRHSQKRSAGEMSTENSFTHPLVTDASAKRSRLMEVMPKHPRRNTYASRRSSDICLANPTTREICRNIEKREITTTISVFTAPLVPPKQKEQQQNISVKPTAASHDSSANSIASSYWSLDQQRSSSVGQQSFNDSGCWMPGSSGNSSTPWENSFGFHKLQMAAGISSYEVFNTAPISSPISDSSPQLATIPSFNLFDEEVFGVTAYRPEEMLNNDYVSPTFSV